MTVVVILVLVLVACLALILGVANLSAVSSRRRALVAGVEDAEIGGGARFAEWDRQYRRTRPGRWTEEQLLLAGDQRSPLAVTLVAVGGGVVVAWVMVVGLAPVFGLMGVVAVVAGIRFYLSRAQQRRNEAFIGQMPELARLLSNATGAGLSIASAIALAANELDAPAGPEMTRVAARMRFGESLETAIGELTTRLPSREVAVLASTLLVSSRSGGSLVTALRDIAETLEERKEIRREVRTILAQSTATGYMVIAMGFGLLFLLNALRPGTVAAMTEDWLGRGALVAGSSLFLAGFALIRRMTRFDG